MVRRVLIVVAVAILTFLPFSTRADSTSGTSTLTVTILPSPLDAAMVTDCSFTVVAETDVANCTGTLVVADPTLEMTGWRINLAATGLTCTCDPSTSLSPHLLAIQAIAGPTLVNGQPVDQIHGPTISATALNGPLSTPQLVSKADPGFGNGAYSMNITFRLRIPTGTPEGIYTADWSITLERQNTQSDLREAESGLKLEN